MLLKKEHRTLTDLDPNAEVRGQLAVYREWLLLHLVNQLQPLLEVDKLKHRHTTKRICSFQQPGTFILKRVVLTTLVSWKPATQTNDWCFLTCDDKRKPSGTCIVKRLTLTHSQTATLKYDQSFLTSSSCEDAVSLQVTNSLKDMGLVCPHMNHVWGNNHFSGNL